MPAYESVIGLEVHAQLKTRTKIFCGCPTAFGAPPNSQTCPVCLGHPGSLPVLNRRAVELAVRGALALGCEVSSRSVFARKNYFYPDLPKGYQITQYEEPLATGGRVAIEPGDATREVDLIRLHLEEDAGKSIQDGMSDSDRHTYVDFNRAGMPLVEIVSGPGIRNPEEAYLFLQRVRSILRCTGVCDGNMEEGSLRCDANVSVRPRGRTELGARTELKNLNSLRNVQRALEYEIARQVELATAGGELVRQTVLWDAETRVTRPMRGKEEVQDYRYFPEPDLPPLMLEPEWVEKLRAELPELPAERKRRLVGQYGLSHEQAHRLSLDLGIADYFEAVARESANPRAAANYILNDLPRERRTARGGMDAIPPPARYLAELIRLVDDGAVSTSVARQELFGEMYRSGRSPRRLLAERGLEQVGDEVRLIELVRSALADYPVQLEKYRAGKTGLLGFFVGKVMRASGGKADPRKVGELLRKEVE
jgi:aspartyl-tRNA(Asn)/glutamyl-tRNA(Gln) amidotransferase subunit B